MAHSDMDSQLDAEKSVDKTSVLVHAPEDAAGESACPTECDEPPPYEPSLTRSLLTLMGAALSLFVSVGFLNAYGVFQAYYEIGPLRSYSDFQISWIGSLATFLTLLGAAPAGILADKFGPRFPMLIGTVCEVLGLMFTSLCKEYYQFFLAQGVLLGIGMGMLTTPAVSAVSHAFKRNRGLGLGATIGGSSIGGLIWPVALNELLNSDGISFGWSLRICGFMVLGCLVVALITVPLAIPPRRKDAHDAKKDQNAPSTDKAKPEASRLKMLQRPAVVLLCSSMAISYFGLFTPFFFVSTYGLSQGLTTSLSFYLVSILNGASFFGRILAGVAADKLGPFNVCSLAVLASALIQYCWTAATSSAGIIVFAAAYGFASGAILSLTTSCAAKLSTPASFGTVIGVAMMSSALAALFGTPISGELVKVSYLALSMFSGSVMLVGGLLIVAARLVQDRRLLIKV